MKNAISLTTIQESLYEVWDTKFMHVFFYKRKTNVLLHQAASLKDRCAQAHMLTIEKIMEKTMRKRGTFHSKSGSIYNI